MPSMRLSSGRRGSAIVFKRGGPETGRAPTDTGTARRTLEPATTAGDDFARMTGLDRRQRAPFHARTLGGTIMPGDTLDEGNSPGTVPENAATAAELMLDTTDLNGCSLRYGARRPPTADAERIVQARSGRRRRVCYQLFP